MSLGALLGSLVLLVGCFDEELPQQNLDGTIVLPADSAEDPRYAGMVFIGLYEGFDPEQLGYPYPQTAPRVGDNPIGDALPYGGTSVGEFAYGCYRALRCQIVSGRYTDLDEVLEVNPVEADEALITTEEMFDQCTYYYGWNSIDEFTFIGDDDLDFALNEDGDWEASWRAWHTQLPAGAILWGFADNDYTSCAADQGQINRKRAEDGVFFREGTNFADVLNFPDKYITEGDLITSEPVTIVAGQSEGYRLVLDYLRD